MWARRRRTHAVLEGVAPTPSFVDPWPVYGIALVMVKIFLGVSDGVQRGCAGETLPNKVPELQESKIATSEAPLGRGLTSNLRSICRNLLTFP